MQWNIKKSLIKASYAVSWSFWRLSNLIFPHLSSDRLRKIDLEIHPNCLRFRHAPCNQRFLKCLVPIFACLFSLEPANASDLGMWVWQRESVSNPAQRKELMEFCGRHGINRLLVQVRFSGEGESRQFADAEAFQEFLKEAGEANVKVEALDGAHDMGLEIRRAETLAKLDAILAFQKQLPASARFSGIHYDIEPYLNPRWKSGDKQGVMREMLDTLSAIRAKVTPELGLTLAHDIPGFYDKHPEALAIEFGGEKKNFHEHIQDLSDYIGVMSYRRKATGPNSIIDLCAAEMAYGEKIGRPVYPAIETGKLDDEPGITFYGVEAETFLGVLKEVRTAAPAASSSYGGVLLHSYRSLRELLEPRKPSNVQNQ